MAEECPFGRSVFQKPPLPTRESGGGQCTAGPEQGKVPPTADSMALLLMNIMMVVTEQRDTASG
jgi:hypothetical protein